MLGMFPFPKLDEFSENFQRGEGRVISDPNNCVADFIILNEQFSEKGGFTSDPKKFLADLSISKKSAT